MQRLTQNSNLLQVHPSGVPQFGLYFGSIMLITYNWNRSGRHSVAERLGQAKPSQKEPVVSDNRTLPLLRCWT